uniref:ORF2 n=1 Tax=Plasmopara viticola lesion associated amalga like virus 1 TaxID=2692081 RepID=A0A6B9Q4Q1_9VIRU|nr:ORF2 [Plasmopara viticola lesion associated amalga like virus 1]
MTRPARDEYYKVVNTTRKKPYADRVEFAKAQTQFNAVVRFCLIVESNTLDKKVASKVVRTLKLVKGLTEFDLKVPAAWRGAFNDPERMLALMDDEDAINNIRFTLVPKKEQILDTEQRSGSLLLQFFESERSKVISQYDDQEKTLMDALKKIRAEKKEFLTEVNTALPTYKKIRDAREIQLTNQERTSAINHYESSTELSSRFTTEAYLLAVRNNKAQREERTLFREFAKMGPEDDIRRRIDDAAAKATATVTVPKPTSGPRPASVSIDADLLEV